LRLCNSILIETTINNGPKNSLLCIASNKKSLLADDVRHEMFVAKRRAVIMLRIVTYPDINNDSIPFSQS